MTDGFSGSRAQSAKAVKRFLVEYLGSPDEPTPFGGRTDELATLDRWLDDPTAPPYAVLTAPAGRGKSAILTQWCAMLAARKDLKVVFLPVSVRFRLNLASIVFGCLAARLAYLHGEAVDEDPGTAEVSRDTVCSYLKQPFPDGRLVLILDAVDEAADWQVGPELLPHPLGKGVKVLVSTRDHPGATGAEAWAQRLSLQNNDIGLAMALPPLSRDGVTEALCRLHPLLKQDTRNEFLIGEIHRLCEGDPLMLRLYIEELRSHDDDSWAFKPDDMRAVQPGLSGYFEHWITDQRELWGEQREQNESLVTTLLEVLACALGPLSREDVLTLAPERIGLTEAGLIEAREALARLVIGDGKHSGYVFGHPRFAQFFFERMDVSRHEAVETRFLDWGRRVMDTLSEVAAAPLEVSSYLLEFYSAHLERVGAGVEELMALTGDAWRRLWYAHESAYSGFVNDVKRAWCAASRANREAARGGGPLPHVATEIHCAMVVASASSAAAQVPTALLPQLVRLGRWTPSQALAYARQMPVDYRRSDTLAALAPYLTEALLEEAITAIWPTGPSGADYDTWVDTLLALAPFLPDRLLAEFIARAELLDGDFRWIPAAVLAPHLPAVIHERLFPSIERHCAAYALKNLAPHLPATLLTKAITVACRINEPMQRWEVLMALSKRLERGRRRRVLEAALEAARACDEIIHGIDGRVWMLGETAKVMSALERRRVAEEALGVAEQLDTVRVRASSMVHLLPLLSDAAQARALDSLQAALPEVSDDYLYVTIKARIAASGGVSEMRAVLADIQRLDYRQWGSEILGYLFPHLPAELYPEALEAARNTGNVKVVNRLAPHADETLWDDLLELMPSLSFQMDMGIALGAIAHLIPERFLGKALATLLATKDTYAFTYAMPQLAPRLDEALRLKALDAARLFDRNERRAECLAVLVEHLPPEMQAEVTEEALAATKLICDGYYRDETLCRLLEYLCSESRTPDPGVLNRAEEVAMGMRGPSARNTAICAVLPHLTGETRDLLARAAVEAAEAISDSNHYFRVRAYLRVLPFLSGPQLEETRERALTQALAFPNAESRTDLIAGFAPFLAADRLSSLLEEALGTALRKLRTEKDKDSAVHGYCLLIKNILEPYAGEAAAEAFGFVVNIATEEIKG